MQAGEKVARALDAIELRLENRHVALEAMQILRDLRAAPQRAEDVSRSSSSQRSGALHVSSKTRALLWFWTCGCTGHEQLSLAQRAEAVQKLCRARHKVIYEHKRLRHWNGVNAVQVNHSLCHDDAQLARTCT